MNKSDILALALGNIAPWKVTKTEMIASEDDINKKELHLYLDFEKGTSFNCPICGEECKAYDTTERVWRHINFFEHLCFIHARVPRVSCGEHGIKMVNVPWARKGTNFTLIMEGLILNLIQHMPVLAVAREIGEHDTKLWRVLNHYVEDKKKTEIFLT